MNFAVSEVTRVSFSRVILRVLANCQVFWIVCTKSTVINQIKFGKQKEGDIMSCICLDSLTFLLKKSTRTCTYALKLVLFCNPEHRGGAFVPTAHFFFNHLFFPVDFPSNHWRSSYMFCPKWPRMHHFTHQFSKFFGGGPLRPPFLTLHVGMFATCPPPLIKSWIRPSGLIFTNLNVTMKCINSAWNTCVCNCTMCSKCKLVHMVSNITLIIHECFVFWHHIECIYKYLPELATF